MQFQDFGTKFLLHTHISRIMDPIDEQCFAFVICIYQKKAGDKAKVSLDWLRRRPQSSATLLQELDRNEDKNCQS